jgi:hypothetical protein
MLIEIAQLRNLCSLEHSLTPHYLMGSGWLADRVVVMKDMQIVGDLPNSHQYEVMSSQIMHCIHESGSEVGKTIEDGVLALQGA